MNRFDDFKLPLCDALLEKFNFFELYPFDGGGYFINQEFARSYNDKEIAENVLAGVLSDFGPLEKLDHSKFERWRSVEKSAWLNRLYFLVPLSKYYRLTNQKKIADLVKAIVLNFIRNNPAPKTEAEIGANYNHVMHIRDNEYNVSTAEQLATSETDIKYVWFDFQVASRIIHLLYSLHFIRGAGVFNEEEYSEVENSIIEHARIIAICESKFQKLATGNHQSLRGLALLYAACFSSGTEEGGLFLAEGLRICKFHIENDYFQNGVLKEISPSYHAFETWHHRDSYLLGQIYGFEVSPRHEAVLAAAVGFLSAMQTPDGNSLVINDGYSLNLKPLQASFPKKLLASTPQKDIFYKGANLAFYRDDDFYFCLDASTNMGKFSHFHAGKNAVTIFCHGQPFLVDSNCCSYDDPKFAFYKDAQRHSTLLVDGVGESVFYGLYDCPFSPTVKIDAWQDDKIVSALTSQVEQWKSVIWTRTVKIGSGCIQITDEICNSHHAGKNYSFLFNLHPQVEVKKLKDKEFFLKMNGTILLVKFEGDGKVEVATGLCFHHFRHQPNQQLVFSTETAHQKYSLKTSFIAE
jgi:hypothetical protein